MALDFVIRFRCDQDECGTENSMVHVTQPQKMPVIVEHFGIKDLPPGWTLTNGKTYCPHHAFRLIKPVSPIVSDLIAGRRL